MATTALSTLLPLMTVPRCPDNVQLRALRNAARRFCIETEAWREDMTAIASVADQEDYTCSAAYSNVIFRRAYKVTVDEVEKSEDLWSFSTAGVLTFDPALTQADQDIVVSVVYVPDVDCTALVDWLVSRWGDVIAAGAEEELKSDPGGGEIPVPWYNTTSAARAEARYDNGVGDAKAEILTNRQSGWLGVEMKDFYL